MLAKNNKPMFFLLLIPFYLLLLVLLIGLTMGSIEWLRFFGLSVLILSAAWSLSRKGGLWINALGLLIFAVLGGALIYTTLEQPERLGPWTINVYFGALLILLGLVAFVYDVIKHKNRLGKAQD